MDATDKITRILMLYTRLERGEIINKLAFAQENNINARTVDRDIQDIRLFLSETYSSKELIYDFYSNGYRINDVKRCELSGVEAFIVLKLLFNSRILRDDEFAGIADTILSLVSVMEQRIVKNQFQEDAMSYVTAERKKAVMKMIWDLIKVIERKMMISINYQSSDNNEQFTICPYAVEITKSGCYLAALQMINNRLHGAVFVIEQIDSFVLLKDRYELTKDDKIILCELITAIRGDKIENTLTNGGLQNV